MKIVRVKLINIETNRDVRLNLKEKSLSPSGNNDWRNDVEKQ